MTHEASSAPEEDFIGWVGDNASASSARSQRSAASSARSRRSVASTAHSQRSHKSSRSASSPKEGKSLQDRLEKLAEKSASTNGSSVAGRSQRSSATHSTKHTTSTRHTASSRRSTSSRNSSVNDVERAPNKSTSFLTDPSSSVSSSGFTSVSSSRSSSASKSTRSSKTSASSTAASSSKKTSNSSISSHRSSSSSRGGGNHSARGKQAEGVDHLEAGDCALAIASFTQAAQEYRRPGGRNEKQAQQALATLYGYRCEALYEIGAYDAAVRDARNALECEILSGSSLGDIPYSSTGRSTSGFMLHPERGAVLRAKVLYLLGISLLRGGNLKGVSDSFEASYKAAEKALEDANDITESGGKPHKRAVSVLKDLMESATEGKSTLREYENLKTKLDTGSYKKDYLELLDGALEIAPASTEWNLAKVMYLIRRRRWFAVANHCEQLAARAAEWDGVFAGDLADIDPFPGIPPARELDPDFFSESPNGAPPHLRTLGETATRDAAFRTPKELLPHYLRALRLEERYKEAVLVGTALSESDTRAGASGKDDFAENKRFTREWEKLDNTIKLKEEGDSLFRDAYYDRAVKLYGECLDIDKGADVSTSGSILRQASSWPVACANANEAGGKLHAVLHSNRAACFSSMGRYEDAVKESSHAIEIHSMYTKAILRRARCYAKIGQTEKAKADFNRYIILVEGARDHPYPPPNQGSSCYFDMPSDVSEQQLGAVKSEMNELGIKPIETRNNQSKMRGSTTRPAIRTGPKTSWLDKLCCKKNVQSQVATQPSYRSARNDGTRTGGGGQRPPQTQTRKVSFSTARQNSGPSVIPPPRSAFPPDPPPNKIAPTLIKSRPAFEHPLDTPSAIDTNVDYYAVLGLAPLASDSDIKQAYHKLAREFHPDRNNSKEAQARFQDIKLAYAILGDSKGKKREYDKAKPQTLEP